MSSRYAQAQQQGRDALRRAILDAAGEILIDEGPRALTMRGIAAAVGCSTSVLYTMFGRKDGLANALYREGFDRLRRQMEEAAASVAGSDDPMALHVALGRAYRAAALAAPNYYRVMFMGAIPGFAPGPEAMAVADESLGVLIEAVREGMEAGVLRPGDPEAVADLLWAAAHGVVSLELAGHFRDPDIADDRYRMLAWAALAPFLADPPAGEWETAPS